MQNEISHMILFTTALCNLNCSYCYICKDKAGGLNSIDKDLEEDLKNLTYIKQVLNYNPDIKNTLHHISLWGGEPSLHLERFTDKFEDYLKAFPNFSEIDMSTNFTLPDAVDKLSDLFSKIEKYYFGTKPFLFDLQLSIDGYEEMNDFGRGKNATKRFVDNFIKLCQLPYNSKKIKLEVHTKPTLSKETFSFLDTEDKCYKWFEFLNNNLGDNCRKYKVKFSFSNCLFNCASPTEWTSEDGKQYAKILNNIYNIKDKVRNNFPDWAKVKTLNPITGFFLKPIEENSYFDLDDYGKSFSEAKCGGGCGVFVHEIVPIPHNMFTMCHRGLFDSYIDYCSNLSDKDGKVNSLSDRYFNSGLEKNWLYTADELKVMQNTMSKMNHCPNKILYTDYIGYIREMAIAGIINQKYTDMKEIQKTLGYFMCNSYCVQDGYIMNGSWTTSSMLEVPLVYNGAMEIAEKEFEEILKEEGLIL